MLVVAKGLEWSTAGMPVKRANPSHFTRSRSNAMHFGIANNRHTLQ